MRKRTRFFKNPFHSTESALIPPAPTVPCGMNLSVMRVVTWFQPTNTTNILVLSHDFLKHRRIFFLLQQTQFDTEELCTFCELFASQNKHGPLSAVSKFIPKPVLSTRKKHLLLNLHLVFVAPQIYNSHI